MYFDRKIVLDKDHRPVKAWPELNLTLSSKVEGFRLEALQRLNPHISARDILARMLPEITVLRRKQNVVRSQMRANALSMRKREFRAKNGMLSWTAREGTKEIKQYLDSLLGPELVAENSTRDMRPLSKVEIEHILLLIGKGRHPERSRHKRTSFTATTGQAETEAEHSHEHNHDDVCDSDVPSNIEDHFEPMDLDEEQGGGNSSHHHTATDIEGHFEPFDPGEVEDEGTLLQPEDSSSDPDLNDPHDCRNHVPSTCSEMEAIAKAIQIPIKYYNSWLDTELKIDAAAFHWESYNTQWLALQEALEKGWVRQRRDVEECPTLVRLARWEGSVHGWAYAAVEYP